MAGKPGQAGWGIAQTVESRSYALWLALSKVSEVEARKRGSGPRGNPGAPPLPLKAMRRARRSSYRAAFQGSGDGSGVPNPEPLLAPLERAPTGHLFCEQSVDGQNAHGVTLSCRSGGYLRCPTRGNGLTGGPSPVPVGPSF
jgi:hypothetical protein